MTTAIAETGTMRIVFDGQPPVVITPRVSDTVAYSMTWKKRGWPSPQEDQLLVGTFAAFAACRRLGHFSGSFEAFTEAVVAIEAVEHDESDQGGEPDPTSAGTAPAPSAPTAPAPSAPTAPAQSPIAETPAPITAPDPTLPAPLVQT